MKSRNLLRIRVVGRVLSCTVTVLGCHVSLTEVWRSLKPMLLYSRKYFNSNPGDAVAVTPASSPNRPMAAPFDECAMLILIVQY